MRMIIHKSWWAKNYDLGILFICLLVSFGAWWGGMSNDRTGEHLLANNKILLEQNLEEKIEHYLDYLEAFQAYYENNATANSDDLEQYIRQLMHDGEYQEILRFALIEKGKQGEFELRALFDRAGKKMDEKAIAGELKIGRESMLTQLNQVKESVIDFEEKIGGVEEYSGSGIIIAVPFERSGGNKGAIVVLLSGEEMGQQIDNWLDPEIGWEWWWAGAKVVGSKGVGDARKMIEKELVMQVEGEKWVFKMITPMQNAEIWNWVLAGGVLLSFVVYAMVYAMSLAGVRAKELAMQMTQDLQKFRLALESSDNHVIITDQDGLITYANPAAQRLTGFSWDEMQGNTPRLWGRQMSSEFYQTFWATIKNKKQVFEGEITNKRKNGEIYQAYATVSPIIGQDGKKLMGYVGVEYDITERKKAENELRRMNELMIGRELRMAELKQQLADKGKKT